MASEAVVHPKPSRVRRMRAFAVSFLFLAGIVNYLDRTSFSIANTSVRADLGLSGTQIGALLSAFSLAYGVAQLPIGLMLDRIGSRVILAAGMFVWSLAQLATGLVSSFSGFMATRISLGVGEAPMMPCGVKVMNDWFGVRDRGLPTGLLTASNTLGVTLAPPVLTVIMLSFGWRAMFVSVGLFSLLLSLAWYPLYRDRKSVLLTAAEAASLGLETERPRTEMSVQQWKRLFRLRTIWGMMLGFGGVNYTTWLYLSWLPGYLQAAHHLTIARTGWVAVIPYVFATLGSIVSGGAVNQLIRRGYAPILACKMLIVGGMFCSALSTLGVAYAPSATGAVACVRAALFFIYFGGNSAWGLAQALSPAHMVGSVSAIQNFGSFVCASVAPLITGWLLDRTHSFDIALVICALFTCVGALSYWFIVKDPIDPVFST
jgi:MFS transporter, ACS family, L-galactonate transporter